MVRCKVCRKKMKVVNYLHLRTHDLTTDSYLHLYPDAIFYDDKARDNLSQACKKHGIGKWMKGKKPASSTLRKMARAQRRICRDPEESKRRSDRARKLGYGKWMKGKTLAPLTVTKIAAHKKGKTYEEIYGDRAAEEIRKRREGNRERWVWKKKRTPRPYHTQDYLYKEWRTAVFERDSYTCRRCGGGGDLRAHHIKGWTRFPSLRYEVSNGKTLCVECHDRLHRKRAKRYRRASPH